VSAGRPWASGRSRYSVASHQLENGEVRSPFRHRPSTLRLPRMNAGGSDRLPRRCFRLWDQRFTVQGRLRRPVHRPSYAEAHSGGTAAVTTAVSPSAVGRCLCGDTPHRVVLLGCVEHAIQWYVRAFTRGNDLPRNAQTRCSWQGARDAFSHTGEQPARGEGHSSPG